MTVYVPVSYLFASVLIVGLVLLSRWQCVEYSDEIAFKYQQYGDTNKPPIVVSISYDLIKSNGT
jgi:hypothetical protein